MVYARRRSCSTRPRTTSTQLRPHVESGHRAAPRDFAQDTAHPAPWQRGAGEGRPGRSRTPATRPRRSSPRPPCRRMAAEQGRPLPRPRAEAKAAAQAAELARGAEEEGQQAKQVPPASRALAGGVGVRGQEAAGRQRAATTGSRRTPRARRRPRAPHARPRQRRRQPRGDPLDRPAARGPGRRSPGEALADAAEAPHPVTTPDDPAEVVDLEPRARPKKSDLLTAAPDRRTSPSGASVEVRLRPVLVDPVVDPLPPPNSQSIRSSRSAGISSRGTCHQPISSRLSIGSSRQTSPTVSMWSRPVCATRTTSASGAASRAAMNPPGRGASTLVIPSARSAIRSSPSLRSRSIARCRRRGVKLPPSGKITNASFSSRSRASSPIWLSRSWPSPGFGVMNRPGAGAAARRSPGPRPASP